MNLRYLHTFVSIAEAGGIARAGARLDVSQPAASRQILALETELGVRLFDRIGRRLRLTSEGEDLLRQSRRLVMEADSLNARARALKGGQTGILRVGARPMAIENTLSRFLKTVTFIWRWWCPTIVSATGLSFRPTAWRCCPARVR
jgi:DNA-binding transcriptional LysR family regulator